MRAGGVCGARRARARGAWSRISEGPPTPTLARNVLSRIPLKHHHGTCARGSMSRGKPSYGLVGTCLRHSGTPVIRAGSLSRAPSRELKRVSAPKSNQKKLQCACSRCKVSPPPQGGRRPPPSRQRRGWGKGESEPFARSCGRVGCAEHAVREYRAHGVVTAQAAVYWFVCGHTLARAAAGLERPVPRHGSSREGRARVLVGGPPCRPPTPTLACNVLSRSPETPRCVCARFDESR